MAAWAATPGRHGLGSPGRGRLAPSCQARLLEIWVTLSKNCLLPSADGLPLHCTGAVPAAIGGVRHTWPGVLRLGKMATGPAFLGEVAAALGPVACWWLQGGSKPLFAHVAFLSPRWVDLERPSQHHQGLVTGILVKILLLEELRALYVLRHSSSGHPNPQAARLMSPSCHRNIWDFFFPPVHLEAEHNHM